MYDLNKTPALVEEGEANPQDSGTEKKMQIQANSATSAAPKTLASSSRNYTFDSSDLAPLLIMVKDLPNYHPGTPNLMFNSNHATLPPHTSAFSESPATAWRGNSSAVSKHLAMVTIAPGDGSPAVRDVTVRQGRVVEVWSRNGASGVLRGTPNQASQCQTTMDLDCHVVSDWKSDSCKPIISRDNSNSKINENIEVSPGALTPTPGWSANLAPRTRYRHAAWEVAAQHLKSHPHQPSNGTNTSTLQQLRNLLPEYVRAPAATTASSSCHAPSAAATTASSSCHASSVPSIPRATGEASSSGIIKFKLFNVEISVAVEPGHGSDRTEAHRESEPQHCDQLILPPRKKCKITGAAAPPTQSPKSKKLCKKCKKCKKCLLAQKRLF